MENLAIINSSMLLNAYRTAANNLKAKQEYVNSLNVFPVPDGDTGTNMYKTISSAVSSINDEQTIDELMKSLARGALMGARGNSGVILSQILRGMANGLDGLTEIAIKDLNRAFVESRNSAYKAVMKPTEGTILTVVDSVARFSNENYKNYTDTIAYLQDLINIGNKTLDKTPTMLKELAEAGVVDAGGKGYMVILEGFLQGLVSDEAIDYDATVDNFEFFANKQNHDPAEIKFSYCTELMINGENDDPEGLREEFSQIGNCVIVVSDGDITKVHVHTNDPGKVLQRALEIGYLSDIKIDNMRLQNKSIEDKKVEEKPSQEVKKAFEFIVVSSGEGLTDIFKSLGVESVIEGGQTMNPSTEDILDKVEESSAEDIYIFPNNKNIIMSAKQVVDLTDKRVHIIETRQVSEAFTAILSFSPEADPETNIENMNEAIADVDTIQVTYAIRDSKNNGLDIRKGDYIILEGSDIVATGKNLESLVMDALDKSIDDEDFIVTIYAGCDAEEREAKKLYEAISSKYDDLDVELILGGQPVYRYLISIE